MATIANYIAKAEECERQAAAASSQAVRDLLLDVARGWRRIAELPVIDVGKTEDDRARREI